jgi:RecA-family ATPase
MAIDMFRAFQEEPPELDFIWPSFLAGTVGALVAPGAAGKSFWALEAAMAVAGADLLKLNPTRTGKVVYFSGEDPANALIRRAHSIGKHLDSGMRHAIRENLILEPIQGKRLNIMDQEHSTRIIKYCSGARLIILDTLSRIHQLDENSNGDMANLIGTLEYVAVRTGASVLYLHHISKSSTKDGQNDQQQAARGASALIDNARWCGFVSKMTENESKNLTDCDRTKLPIGTERKGSYVRYGVSKQNYDADPVNQWYQRQEGGVLVAVELYRTRDRRSNKQSRADFND